jgi:hypothetical protein
MKIDGDAKLIAAAFVKARGAMDATVTKDAKGNYGKYATLAAIVEATAEHLAKHGLAVIQEASLLDSGVMIETWLIHESGATIQFAPLTMPLAQRTPQAVGSATTYGRRYALAAICGLAPDDDDGQAAEDAAKPQASAAKPQPRAKLSDDQLETLQTVGRTYYGDAWGKEQARLSEKVSTGAVNRIADLMPQDADKLINGLQKKIAEAEAQAAPQTV